MGVNERGGWFPHPPGVETWVNERCGVPPGIEMEVNENGGGVSPPRGVEIMGGEGFPTWHQNRGERGVSPPHSVEIEVTKGSGGVSGFPTSQRRNRGGQGLPPPAGAKTRNGRERGGGARRGFSTSSSVRKTPSEKRVYSSRRASGPVVQ